MGDARGEFADRGESRRRDEAAAQAHDLPEIADDQHEAEQIAPLVAQRRGRQGDRQAELGASRSRTPVRAARFSQSRSTWGRNDWIGRSSSDASGTLRAAPRDSGWRRGCFPRAWRARRLPTSNRGSVRRSAVGASSEKPKRCMLHVTARRRPRTTPRRGAGHDAEVAAAGHPWSSRPAAGCRCRMLSQGLWLVSAGDGAPRRSPSAATIPAEAATHREGVPEPWSRPRSIGPAPGERAPSARVSHGPFGSQRLDHSSARKAAADARTRTGRAASQRMMGAGARPQKQMQAERTDGDPARRRDPQQRSAVVASGASVQTASQRPHQVAAEQQRAAQRCAVESGSRARIRTPNTRQASAEISGKRK